MTDALSIAVSGLRAQEQKLSATAENIANVATTGAVPDAANPSAPASTVYRPLNVGFITTTGGGVQADIKADPNGYSIGYDPDSRYANKDGQVAVPNVDLATEAVNLLTVKTAFKADISVIKAQDKMNKDILDIIT